MVNGYSALALTKLDILDDLDQIQVGVTYKKNEEPMEHFPSCEQVSVRVVMPLWRRSCQIHGSTQISKALNKKEQL